MPRLRSFSLKNITQSSIKHTVPDVNFYLDVALEINGVEKKIIKETELRGAIEALKKKTAANPLDEAAVFALCDLAIQIENKLPAARAKKYFHKSKDLTKYTYLLSTFHYLQRRGNRNVKMTKPEKDYYLRLYRTCLLFIDIASGGISAFARPNKSHYSSAMVKSILEIYDPLANQFYTKQHSSDTLLVSNAGSGHKDACEKWANIITSKKQEQAIIDAWKSLYICFRYISSRYNNNSLVKGKDNNDVNYPVIREFLEGLKTIGTHFSELYVNQQNSTEGISSHTAIRNRLLNDHNNELVANLPIILRHPQFVKVWFFKRIYSELKNPRNKDVQAVYEKFIEQLRNDFGLKDKPLLEAVWLNDEEKIALHWDKHVKNLSTLQDNTGMSALHIAVLNNNEKLFNKIMVAAPKLLNSQDKIGNSYLHYAVLINNPYFLRKLPVNNNAPILNILNSSGQSALHMAVQTIAQRQVDEQIINGLLARGIRANVRDIFGKMALNYLPQETKYDDVRDKLEKAGELSEKQYQGIKIFKLVDNSVLSRADDKHRRDKIKELVKLSKVLPSLLNQIKQPNETTEKLAMELATKYIESNVLHDIFTGQDIELDIKILVQDRDKVLIRLETLSKQEIPNMLNSNIPQIKQLEKQIETLKLQGLHEMVFQQKVQQTLEKFQSKVKSLQAMAGFYNELYKSLENLYEFKQLPASAQQSFIQLYNEEFSKIRAKTQETLSQVDETADMLEGKLKQVATEIESALDNKEEYLASPNQEILLSEQLDNERLSSNRATLFHTTQSSGTVDNQAMANEQQDILDKKECVTLSQGT